MKTRLTEQSVRKSLSEFAQHIFENKQIIGQICAGSIRTNKAAALRRTTYVVLLRKSCAH